MEQRTNQQAPARVGSKWEQLAGIPLSKKEKFFGIILLVAFLFIFYVSLDANKYGATLRVIEGDGKVGVNPTTERLDFGDLSKGTSGTRRVDIKNDTYIPMWIAVVKIGAISDLITINNNFFVLRPGAEEKIEFTAYVPASAMTERTYDGRVFVFRVPF